MNKSILMKFAIESRNVLMASVETSLATLGFTATEIPAIRQSGDKVFINEKEYLKSQYDDLLLKLKEQGYEQLKESMAYTWFNRFVALRFMEVNEYMNEKIITSSTSKIEPDLVSNFRDASFYDKLSGAEKDYLLQLKDNDNVETLYAKLVVYKCNDLNKSLPFMFEKMGDYTELLFPNNLISKGSFLESLREAIYREGEEPIDVEIIGWLYQYYNSQYKDEVFSDLKKNKKLTKDTIPAATQLFTPKWIVKYMVENSLGNLLLESTEGLNYDKLLELKKDWKYYINQEVTKAEILPLEEIKLIDPCMGSGHILVYAFDFLYKVYEAFGYSERDIVRNILEKNLYGLEIDDRATQLAQFALVMKARERYKRLFRILENDPIKLNTYAIQESKENVIDGFTRQLIGGNGLTTLNYLADKFNDAKELGSILTIKDFNLEKALSELNTLKIKLGINESPLVLERLEALIYQADNLARKYDVVVTNPPYMTYKSMGVLLGDFVKKKYPDSKGDLFAVFIERCGEFTNKNRYTAMITMHSWMFLNLFETLRIKLVRMFSLLSLIHLGSKAFEDIGGEVVQTVSWITKNVDVDIKGTYIRLVDYNTPEEKEKEFFKYQNYFYSTQTDFDKIPNSPIAYWIKDKIKDVFTKAHLFFEDTISDGQNVTGNNNKYLKLIWEVDSNKIISEQTNKEKSYIFYAKGGSFRRWYGNIEYLILWTEEARNHYRKDKISRLIPEYLWYRKGITWSLITSGDNIGFRLLTENSTFDKGGSSLFFSDETYIEYFLGFLNTKIVSMFLKIYNPTVNLQVKDIRSLPIIKVDERLRDISYIVKNAVKVAQSEWDSRETSWDFKKSPLLDFGVSINSGLSNGSGANIEIAREGIMLLREKNSPKNIRIENAIDMWFSHAKDQFVQMHKNEEELNKIFIDIYGLADEMDEKVEFKDITLYKDEFKIEPLIGDISLDSLSASDLYLAERKTRLNLNLQELIKQFVSYGVGCIMGRYSLDKEGLIIANSDDKLIINTVGADSISVQELLVVGASLEDAQPDIRHTIPNPTFIPDEDGIIPVVDTEFFEDDIVSRFIDFVKVAFGSEYLDTNLLFIANALDKKDIETSKDAIRRYFLDKFMDDHIKRYNKRPIYWMFQSGPKSDATKKGKKEKSLKAFNCLVYLHRYHENTVGKIRQEYLLPYQARIQSELNRITEEMDTASNKGQSQTLAQVLANKINEIKTYDEDVKYFTEHKEKLDLDNGVAFNYKRLAKILYDEPKITKSKED